MTRRKGIKWICALKMRSHKTRILRLITGIRGVFFSVANRPLLCKSALNKKKKEGKKGVLESRGGKKKERGEKG